MDSKQTETRKSCGFCFLALVKPLENSFGAKLTRRPIRRIYVVCCPINKGTMKVKLCVALLSLTIITSVRTLAQLPLVYNVENTGSKYKAPVLPALEKLPVIDPLTDPFMQSDGKK